MPYLKKHKRNSCSDDQNRKGRQKVYSSAKWRKMRLAYIDRHPLCEICQQKGLVEAAVDVHHKVSFTKFTGMKMIEMAYNPNNLMALCKECHSKIHKHHGKEQQ